VPTILTAAQCPSPVIPAALVSPAAGNPLTSDSFLVGESANLRSKLNRNAVREDLVGRWGGGAYAVVQGLAISAGAGLLLNVAAGQAMMDGPVTVPTNTTLALLDNTARSYIWISQTGVLFPVPNSLVAPAGAQCFIGSAVTAGGVVTSVDQSGILYLRGGTAWRQTADTSCPTDTPPAGLIFLNEGASGMWLWDGLKYVCLSGGRAALQFSADADKTLTASEQANSFIDFLNAGTALTATRNVILPTESGRSWLCRNNSNGAQSLTFKTVAGTGITVATAKTQRLTCDGTNVIAEAAPFP
jgi:hypothetical protein